MAERRKPKKIKFASAARFERLKHLAPRFFSEVLKMEYSDLAFVSDLSDLHDFTGPGSMDEFFERFESHYLIDPRQIGSTRIVDLLELLERNGVAT